MYQFEIRCFGLWGDMLNPMMSSLTDSAVSQTARLSAGLSAHCHLMEITEDCGSQIHYYRYMLLSFLVSGIFTFYRGGFCLTYRKLRPSPIILGTKTQSALFDEHNPVSQLLLSVPLKRRMVNGKLVYNEIPSD